MEPCSNILVLLGPTGVGKTELSLRLAEYYHCPIINADSRQIYRELPIGTAAPTADEQRRVKHYLVATHELEDTYNAGQFARDAQDILNQLGEESKPGICAIVSGGSMLYIDALCGGLDDIPDVPADVRERVRVNYKEKGLEWLQNQVQQLDPEYWETVDRQNPQRLMHCVEVTLAAGKPYSTYRRGSSDSPTGNHQQRFIKVGLNRKREELYERINRRVDGMMQEGLEAEAQNAYHRLAAPTVGYRELFDFFAGRCTKEQAVDMIKQNSRHYAKRQLTWWRRDNSIHWLDATLDYEELLHTIDELLHADDVVRQEQC